MEDAADGVGGLRTLDGWGRVVVLKAIVGVLGEAIAGAVAGALEGGRGGAGGAAGNIFGDVAERKVVAGGCGFEDDVVAIPVGGVVADEGVVFDLVAVVVEADGAEDDEAAFEELAVDGAEGVAVGGLGVGVHFGPRSVVGVGGRDLAGRAEDGIDELNLAELRERATGLIPVVAVADEVGEGPAAGIGIDAGAEEREASKVILDVGAEEGVELEVAEAGVLHVGDGAADVMGIGAAGILLPVGLAVGLEEVRVGGAVGEVFVDVDERGDEAAVEGDLGGAEAVVFVEGEFEEEGFPDGVIEVEGDVAVALPEDRGVERRGKRAAGEAKGGAADGVGEALAG